MSYLALARFWGGEVGVGRVGHGRRCEGELTDS